MDKICTYKPGTNEPCAECPRKMSTLYMCGVLQEIAASTQEEE